jgi:predicted metalloprotease
MRWKGRRKSTNVVDSRGKKVANTAGAAVLLNFVGRRFGMKGILVMAVVVGVLWMTGLVDPTAFLGGTGSQTVPYQPSPAEQERFNFVTVVLADTEDVWTAEFARHGETYPEPHGNLPRSDQHRLWHGLGANGSFLLSRRPQGLHRPGFLR